MFDDDDYGKRNPYHIPPGNWPGWWKAVQTLLVVVVAVIGGSLLGWLEWMIGGGWSLLA